MTYFLFRVQGSGGGFAAKKEANSASLRSAAPSKGRGSRGCSLLPLEGGAPKGRRLEGESGILDTQPSPRGEGAPKGRIGYWRYERERGGSSQVGDIREHLSADFFIKGRYQVAVLKALVPSSPSSGSPYRARRFQCADRPQRSRIPVRASLYSPLRDGYRSGRCDGRRCRSHEGRACRGRIRSA